MACNSTRPNQCLPRMQEDCGTCECFRSTLRSQRHFSARGFNSGVLGRKIQGISSWILHKFGHRKIVFSKIIEKNVDSRHPLCSPCKLCSNREKNTLEYRRILHGRMCLADWFHAASWRNYGRIANTISTDSGKQPHAATRAFRYRGFRTAALHAKVRNTRRATG